MDYLRATAKGEPWPAIEDLPGAEVETESIGETHSEDVSTPNESESAQIAEVHATEDSVTAEKTEPTSEANQETTPQESTSPIEEVESEDGENGPKN
jgi:hypothetical protein